MRQGNHVKEATGMKKIIEYIKLALEPLTEIDEVKEDVEGLKEIEDATDKEAISKLEKSVNEVYIPLDDRTKGIVSKANVSTKKAMEMAEKTREEKKQKEQEQEQREN